MKYLDLISKWGDKMSDGLLVPGRADGMATFNVKKKIALIRNHENSPELPKYSAFGESMELLSKIERSRFLYYGYGKTPWAWWNNHFDFSKKCFNGIWLRGRNEICRSSSRIISSTSLTNNCDFGFVTS